MNQGRTRKEVVRKAAAGFVPAKPTGARPHTPKAAPVVRPSVKNGPGPGPGAGISKRMVFGG